MIGGLIGGAIVGFMLADLLAFYSFSAIFAYSYGTANKVFYATFAYVQLAWWVTQTREFSENYRFLWLRRLHGGASKSLWYLLWAVMLLTMTLPWIVDAAATKSVRYVELVGTWEHQGLHIREMGSDSTSTPVAERSPVLRDILSGEVIAAFDGTGESEAYGLIQHRCIEIKNNYCQACAKPENVTQARVRLETTLFGKNKIVRVDYVDFDDLPQPVQQSVIRRLGGMRSAFLALWHLRKAHPELAELINQSLASSRALDD